MRTFSLAGALTAALTVGMLAAGVAQRQELPLLNGDFEQGLRAWVIPEGEGMTSLSQEQAASGRNSLKIVDQSDTRGSDARAARVPINGAGVFELQGKVYPVSGSGLGIYVRVLDQHGNIIGQGDDYHLGAPSEPRAQWIPWRLTLYTPDEARFLEVWVHSYMSAIVTAYLDDLKLFSLGTEGMRPPWPGSYKLRPDEKEKLTEADVVGPDGIVYPDWRWAGVPGGIPRVAVAARAEEFGARVDDDQDDSDALERAADAVGRRGGGALLLAPGTYHLDRPILIVHDNVVLRGAGSDRTRILFRYGAPADGVGFFRPRPGDTVTRATWVEVHAVPKGLQALAIEVDGILVTRSTRTAHWGSTFSLRTTGSSIVGKVPDGEHSLKAIAEYEDGKRLESTIRVRTQAAASPEEPHVPSLTAAIMFAGISTAGRPLKLAEDGKRGARELVLESVEGLAPGDRIRLRGPATPRWKELTRNACLWGEYRRGEYLVEAVNGNRVRLNQPLRIEFPVIDGSYVEEIRPLRRCGVEDFRIEQTQNLWTSGIVFSNAWECWARGVTVKKAGRFPLYFVNAKWGEIRDCVLDDAWDKGGGGTAY
ncbi:MAG: glycosyl hydrolase family 28-related protein, partial [Armatimonadota bacterium]|nr:glycosyl hydrolase family 28-related protein [Armatimonadota bacterium]